MSLLVPNARHAQALAVVRSLRPLAERIVAVAEGRWPAARLLAHVAYAAVDRRAKRGTLIPRTPNVCAVPDDGRPRHAPSRGGGASARFP